MNYIEALQNRYSVKKFNRNKVSATALKDILKAGKLSASSLGLQPYKIYVIASEDLLAQLQEAYYNPTQVATCSHLIVLTSKKDIENPYIDSYFRNIAEIRGITVESLEPFRNSINFYKNKIGQERLIPWNEKQCYIVLANLMFAAALERVDTCPMEGFIPDKIEEILNIDTQAESVTVTLAIGYRAEDDEFQKMKKVRKSDDDLFVFL